MRRWFVSSILLHGLLEISRDRIAISLVMMELHWLPNPSSNNIANCVHWCTASTMVTARNTWRRWFFLYLPCQAASAFDPPQPRTTTSVALNSNLVSAHSLWPPQKHGTPYRILSNKPMILLNLGKTWKPIWFQPCIQLTNILCPLSVFCRKGLNFLQAMMMMMMMMMM